MINRILLVTLLSLVTQSANSSRSGRSNQFSSDEQVNLSNVKYSPNDGNIGHRDVTCCSGVGISDAFARDSRTRSSIRGHGDRVTLPFDNGQLFSFESDLTGDQQHYNPIYSNANPLSQWPMNNYFMPINRHPTFPASPMNVPFNGFNQFNRQLNPSMMSLLALFSQPRSSNSLINNEKYRLRDDGSNIDTKWPQVFTFSDERVNLDKFESAKKKSSSSNVESLGLSPRDSYLILHGGNYV